MTYLDTPSLSKLANIDKGIRGASPSSRWEGQRRRGVWRLAARATNLSLDEMFFSKIMDFRRLQAIIKD